MVVQHNNGLHSTAVSYFSLLFVFFSFTVIFVAFDKDFLLLLLHNNSRASTRGHVLLPHVIRIFPELTELPIHNSPPHTTPFKLHPLEFMPPMLHYCFKCTTAISPVAYQNRHHPSPFLLAKNNSQKNKFLFIRRKRRSGVLFFSIGAILPFSFDNFHRILHKFQ